MRPCTACARHVKYADTTCPFCGEGLEAKACAPKTMHAMTRAALVFASATAVSACGGESGPTTTSSGSTADGGTSTSSSGGETSSGEAMPSYGAIAFPPADAGTSGTSGTTSGGATPVYGAPAFDAGDK